MHPEGAPQPNLPSVAQIISDQSLDWQDDQLPQPATSPLRVVALGPDFQQAIIDLQYGPATPQVAAVTGHAAASLQIEMQKGPSGAFGDISVRGRTARKCVAFRRWDAESTFLGFMLLGVQEGLCAATSLRAVCFGLKILWRPWESNSLETFPHACREASPLQMSPSCSVLSIAALSRPGS